MVCRQVPQQPVCITMLMPSTPFSFQIALPVYHLGLAWALTEKSGVARDHLREPFARHPSITAFVPFLEKLQVFADFQSSSYCRLTTSQLRCEEDRGWARPLPGPCRVWRWTPTASRVETPERTPPERPGLFLRHWQMYRRLCPLRSARASEHFACRVHFVRSVCSFVTTWLYVVLVLGFQGLLVLPLI